jgi:hypothetical protein
MVTACRLPHQLLVPDRDGFVDSDRSPDRNLFATVPALICVPWYVPRSIAAESPKRRCSRSFHVDNELQPYCARVVRHYEAHAL